MFKKILLSLVTVSFFSSQVFAAKTPGLIFKDLKMNLVASDTMEIVYKNQTSTIRRIDAQRFKLNNQDVTLGAGDTLEKVQIKIEKAYMASGKRSAALDELFIPKSHAVVPALFAAFFGGIIGLALGSSQCSSNSNNNSDSGDQGQGPPAGATYVAPSGVVQ